MKNINDDTIKQLISWRTFKTNQHAVANTLKLSDNDAQQELLNELISHRFNKYTATELSELITAHDNNRIVSYDDQGRPVAVLGAPL